MGLKEQIQSDIVVAMKAHEKDRTDALRLLKAAIQRFELDHTDSKSPLYGKPIDEDAYMGVVVKEIKQRKDSIEQFQKGGRQDLVEKEEAELRIFESYLPTQLTREEVVAAITTLVEREGKEFKKVMPAAAKELKGKADAKMVNEVVRELTS